jgi:hypothetical protein
MIHRFLLHSLSHTLVAVDITDVGPPTKAYPRAGPEQTVPIIRFQGWGDAERYFLTLGASAGALGEAAGWLRKTSVAVLTIT